MLRWVGFVVLLMLYGLRVWLLQGYYIVTYGLGIYLLNLFIGFLQPQDDMEADAQRLPVDKDEEFHPFIRRVPEFKFWFVPSLILYVSTSFVVLLLIAISPHFRIFSGNDYTE